jgi:anti-sigma-K factor RskA
MHTLVGAYVMDAVPEDDRAAFERHVLGCEQCREDVRGLREATSRLGSAAAVLPRPELRDQTLQAAARIRQLPPVLAGGRDERRRGRGPTAIWRRMIRPAGSGRPGWLAWVAVCAAVILAATAIAFGLRMTSMQTRLTAAQQRDNAIAAVLGAHDATTRTAHVSTGGMATVVMSHRADALVFIANGLTTLPAAKAYELWLMSPARAWPAGMLPPERHGMSGPMVVNRLGPGDMLGLTVEPATGSRQPTSAPIMLVGLGP